MQVKDDDAGNGRQSHKGISIFSACRLLIKENRCAYSEKEISSALDRDLGGRTSSIADPAERRSPASGKGKVDYM